ncbi:hypothetical protein MUA33_04890 [Staphylococcus delphini]|uniref:hypothetical protein n=1 Tax=Staphylococcus delphini TaxID=53344 RepID=UPI001362B55B|nr:hypothetical protein [Staphylococcus delphini]NBK47612.1 hypothetical protein [Staphylococcus delphini]UXS30122.1 hypothetical protein MUA33_04890 [Staphylococcus delphini]UXS37791.1 hypothetical protein MUA34_05125 [Staphylococcus delphini]UXS45272.1 hypothetical protein MUA39_05250 [Staphylococcus delphini]UXV45892.1 hypothetical protein MUA63_05215 [Staphylococcus delphini]
MIRKPAAIEIVIFLYALYVTFTLALEPSLFSKIDNDVYKGYVNLLGSQSTLMHISLSVAIFYLIGFFTKRPILKLALNTIGFFYFGIVTSSFLLNYPNLGLGIMVIVLALIFRNLMCIIDEDERRKVAKIKNQIVAELDEQK